MPFIIDNRSFFVLLLALLGHTGAQHQFITLFKQSGTCDSNITANVMTHHTSSGAPNPLPNPLNDASSALIFGMWQLGLCQVGGCQTVTYRTEVANEGRCVGLTPNLTWTSQPMPLVRLGDEFMKAGELYLYVNPDYDKSISPFLITPRGETFSFSLNVRSYFFTGNHKWTLYEGAEYKGRAIYLRPSSQVSQLGYGFTYAPNVNYTIRSVRYGSAVNHVPYGTTMLLSFLIAMMVKSNF